MHVPDGEQRAVAACVAEWAMDRLADRRAGGEAARAELAGWQLPEVTGTGIGTSRAWAILRDRVLATAQATDHPRYLAFVPGAPSVAAVLADMAVSAAGVYGGSQLEAGAVVEAERAALRWLSDVIGLPPGAHGAFVAGGTMANLSALVVARQVARQRHGRRPDLILAGAGAHSSIASAATVMGCDLQALGDPDRPMRAADLRRALAGADPRDVVAVVAMAGATNTGAIDELDEVARICADRGIWLHVDAAYGGAAMLSQRCRPAFRGIEAADSVTVNPHKWLFTPFDCAALLYRDPAAARSVHAQTAPYLDVVNGAAADNPADYAVHLSRRARGLPLWMSLLAHGTVAYARAVETCLDLADHAVMRIRDDRALELAVEPTLSVVVFRRQGWLPADYLRWSEAARRRGLGLVTPTTVDGGPALRMCFVNPQTTTDDIDLILDDLAPRIRTVASPLTPMASLPMSRRW